MQAPACPRAPSATAPHSHTASHAPPPTLARPQRASEGPPGTQSPLLAPLAQGDVERHRPPAGTQKRARAHTCAARPGVRRPRWPALRVRVCDKQRTRGGPRPMSPPVGSSWAPRCVSRRPSRRARSTGAASHPRHAAAPQPGPLQPWCPLSRRHGGQDRQVLGPEAQAPKDLGHGHGADVPPQRVVQARRGCGSSAHGWAAEHGGARPPPNAPARGDGSGLSRRERSGGPAIGSADARGVCLVRRRSWAVVEAWANLSRIRRGPIPPRSAGG